MNNLHAEQALLGCLLTDNSTWDEVGDFLQPDDFVLRLHSEVYCAVRDLISIGKHADIICVSEYLSARNGGDDPFVQLCDINRSMFTLENVKVYADFIKQKSIDRKMIAAAQEIIVSVNEQKEDRLDQAQQRLTDIADRISFRTTSASEILADVLTIIDERQNNQSQVIGSSTGFSNLDNIIHGLHGGDLIILAGRPSMGKTLLAMNIAEHVSIIEKKTVATFSLEMSKEQLIERSLSSVGKISANQMRSGNLNESDFQKISSAVSQYQNTKLFIHDKASLNVSDMRAICRRIKREHGLSLVVVDYITLMGGDGENETQRIGNISRGLKLIARDLEIPVIAISQLNRSVEHRNEKRPTMADLRQSGAIEQDADLILFIYRDEIYDTNSPNKGVAEIIIAKHRNGSLDTILLKFNCQYCRFDDYTGTYINTSKVEKKWKGKSFDYD